MIKINFITYENGVAGVERISQSVRGLQIRTGRKNTRLIR